MSTPRVRAGGGLAAIGYVLRKGREAGGIGKLYGRLRSRNACKTCAVGMGGLSGGMVNVLATSIRRASCANGSRASTPSRAGAGRSTSS
jgi:hypothetical protein